MVHYRLTYFNSRGRAELARYLFAFADQQYEDKRVEQADWPAVKPTTLFGQLPFLEVEDGADKFTLAQSVTIARYLARRFNLAGQGEREQAEVDMYADQITDLFNEFVPVIFETDEARKAELNEKFKTQTAPNNFKIFEARLSQSQSGYFVNSGVTYADLYLLSTLDVISESNETLLASHPHVKKLSDDLRAHPKIAAWIASRPATKL
jgi:glutathione S-transferase